MAVRSPQSNGIAGSLVKTMKRDYIEVMQKPDSRTAVGNLTIAFAHYNEQRPNVSFTSGIFAQSGITTPSGKECLDI
jgi:transposase InsO family protein